MSETTRTVPRDSLQFSLGPIEFQPPVAGQAGAVVPVRMVARSSKPVFHKDFKGAIVHDFSGMRPPAPKIPLDYAHSAGDVIGFANSFQRSADGLEVSGVLVPYKEGDRASEIKFKADNGVPWQASIFFDDAVAQELDEFQSAEVNGQTIKGPATIIRQWTLRGVAICPYGVDKDTPVSLSADGDATVTFLDKEPLMAAETPVVAAPPAEPVKPEAEFNLTPTPESGELAAAGQKKCGECGEFSEPKDGKCSKCGKPIAKDEEDSDDGEGSASDDQGKYGVKRTGKDYLAAFGQFGAVCFAEGKNWDETQAAYIAKLQSDNAALSAKLAAVPQFGEAIPLSAEMPAEAAQDPHAAELEKKLGSANLAKFAASIKLPNANRN